jgi:hypothetical protein
MSRSRFLLVTLLVVVGLALVAGAYEMGLRTRPLNRDPYGIYYVQASLAFAHYTSYGSIADYLERKCYDAALAEAKEMRDAQVVLLADNLQRTRNDPSLLEYIRFRDPELLKSVLAGHVPELPTPAKPLTVTCP